MCLLYKISLQACHVPGTENSTADVISRNLLQVFFKRIPRARATLSPISSQLWDILVKTQPDWRSENWRRSLANSLRLSYATIRSYLSAIRFLHLSNGYTDHDPIANTLQLSLLLKGAQRRKPVARDKRLPITPLILEKITQY